jgi:hypothetical protein
LFETRPVAPGRRDPGLELEKRRLKRLDKELEAAQKLGEQM